MLTAEPLAVLHDLATAVVRETGRVEDPVVILDAAHVPIQEEEVVLISVIFILHRVVDLAYQIEVALLLLISLTISISLSILTSFSLLILTCFMG